jgi:hypothetical protein
MIQPPPRYRLSEVVGNVHWSPQLESQPASSHDNRRSKAGGLGVLMKQRIQLVATRQRCFAIPGGSIVVVGSGGSRRAQVALLKASREPHLNINDRYEFLIGHEAVVKTKVP